MIQIVLLEKFGSLFISCIEVRKMTAYSSEPNKLRNVYNFLFGYKKLFWDRIFALILVILLSSETRYASGDSKGFAYNGIQMTHTTAMVASIESAR